MRFFYGFEVSVHMTGGRMHELGAYTHLVFARS